MIENTRTLIDTHCHLDMKAYDKDLDSVLARASETGVKTIITIGIDVPSSIEAVRLAENYSQVYAAVGIHPHDVANAVEDDFHTLARLAKHDKVIGYGEIGLDYAKQYSPEDLQKNVFSKQLELAKELGLPVIIHDRDAHEDTLRLLRKHAPFPSGGVMHCFSGDTALANSLMELGFFISIPGIVTFKNAHYLHQVAATLPLQSMLIETDGPFLAPVPYRGKRNEPSYIIHTAERIAQLAGVSLDTVVAATTKNAQTLFKLNPL